MSLRLVLDATDGITEVLSGVGQVRVRILFVEFAQTHVVGADFIIDLSGTPEVSVYAFVKAVTAGPIARREHRKAVNVRTIGECLEALEMAIKALEQEPKISLEAYKQVAKERDIAIEQLHELGYEFGEKMPTTQERQAESDKFDAAFQDGYNNGYAQARFDYGQEPILDKIYADIQKLRGCSCSCSDGIIDDIEDILDQYKGESEEEK